METVGRRVQWILDNCRQTNGDAWNATTLSKAAGLSSVSHVGMLIRGDVKKGSPETLTKIARAAGVSLTWLVSGEGDPIHGQNDPLAPESEKIVPIRFGKLLNWSDLRERALRAEPNLEAWALDKLADKQLMVSGPALPSHVIELAWHIQNNEPNPPPRSRGRDRNPLTKK